jgi:hypothetical protein
MKLIELKIAIEVLTTEQRLMLNKVPNQFKQNLKGKELETYLQLEEIKILMHQQMLKIVLDNYE